MKKLFSSLFLLTSLMIYNGAYAQHKHSQSFLHSHQIQSVCNNPTRSQVSIEEIYFTPQANDTCFPYADANNFKLRIADGNLHRVKQVDVTLNTTFESGWFTGETLIPRVANSLMRIYVSTVTVDTCPYEFNHGYRGEAAIAPVLCNVGSGLSDLVVFPVPVTAGGSVTVEFTSTVTGTGYVTLNLIVGNTSTTQSGIVFIITTGVNSISLPTPTAGIFDVTVQMPPFYLEKRIIVQ